MLATYVGDEFLALYHCIRSLAVKEPFPDAHDNLILLFERVIVDIFSCFYLIDFIVLHIDFYCQLLAVLKCFLWYYRTEHQICIPFLERPALIS